MRKDSFWFPHDSNAKDDPKCVLLIDQLGLEGYGIYWVLVETLREQPDYKYPLSLIPALARRNCTTAEKMMAVIRGYQLFSFDSEDFFFSESLTSRMIPMEQRRVRTSLMGRISAALRGADVEITDEMLECSSDEVRAKLQDISNLRSTQVQLELNQSSTKRKENKIKDNKREENIIIKEEKKEVLKKKQVFDFRNAVLGLGVEKQTLDDWLIVRKQKKASNTETAFNRLVSQINKAKAYGYTAEDCISVAAANSWQGFQADWIINMGEKKDAPVSNNNPVDPNLLLINKVAKEEREKDRIKLEADRKRALDMLSHEPSKYTKEYLINLCNNKTEVNRLGIQKEATEWLEKYA